MAVSDDVQQILTAVEYTPPGQGSVRPPPASPPPSRFAAFRGVFGATVVDGETAIRSLQLRYQQLSTWASQIAPIAHLVPCAIINAYQQAVREYRGLGKSIFDELDKQKLAVAQIVYKDGQPVPDPARPGQFLTRTLSAPLSPPVFVASSFVRCPGLTDVYAPMAGSFGRTLVSVNLGVVPLIIGGIIVVSVVTGAAVALHEIRLAIRPENPKPADTVGAFLACVEKLRAAGSSAEAAAGSCQRAADTGQRGGDAGVTLGTIAAVLAAAGLVYFLFLRKPSLSTTEGAGDDLRCACF